MKNLKHFCLVMIDNSSAIAFNLCDADPAKTLEYQRKADAYKEVLNYLNDKHGRI